MESLKQIARRTFRAAGLNVSRATPDRPHEEVREVVLPPDYAGVRSCAGYTPWNTDRAFREVYEMVCPFTLVDENRCFCLWSLVEQVAKLERGNILEVGVWRGGTGALIAEKARLCSVQGEVFLCDTFSGVVKAGNKDPHYSGGEHADTEIARVEDLLFGRMKLRNVKVLQGVFPDDTGHLVSDLSFRMCHVDVDVYQSAKDVVEWVWPRLETGGVIVFDDYGFDTCSGLRRYVDELLREKHNLGFYNLSGQAFVLKLA
jgi:O-methyltransferase